jgi:hypothetical protein
MSVGRAILEPHYLAFHDVVEFVLILIKEKIMGKLKQALIGFNEQRAIKGSKVIDPRYRGMIDSDWANMVGSEEAWAQYEAEFNDWLDRYEASFGGQGDQL